jgi:hypothetical protein
MRRPACWRFLQGTEPADWRRLQLRGIPAIPASNAVHRGQVQRPIDVTVETSRRYKRARS